MIPRRKRKCIVIDPEREFRDICRELGGSWLDAGGGRSKTNILQIHEPLRDDEDDPNSGFGSNPNVFGQHIWILKNIFQYKYPSLTDVQLQLLERSLYGLYKGYGIDNDWAFEPRRPAREYPVLEEWYRFLLREAEKDPRYDDLALLVESMAVGSEAAIWNGHTNIDLAADLVVIDTKRLQDAPAATRTAQYYNLMRMAFSAASADRETEYCILCDESQVMFDPNFPVAAAALKNMALRVRKYEGYLWLIFHSIHELLDESIRQYGQPILDTATYKILFGADGQGLSDIVQLYKLTRAEERVLEGRQRGRAVGIIGAQRLVLHFDIPAYKLALMGKGGGR